MKALLCLLCLCVGTAQAQPIVLYTKKLSGVVTWELTDVPALPFGGICLKTDGVARWECLLMLPDGLTQRWYFIPPGRIA